MLQNYTNYSNSERKSGISLSNYHFVPLFEAFPKQKEQIKQYVRDNKLDMMTAENALQVIDYIFSL